MIVYIHTKFRSRQAMLRNHPHEQWFTTCKRVEPLPRCGATTPESSPPTGSFTRPHIYDLTYLKLHVSQWKGRTYYTRKPQNTRIIQIQNPMVSLMIECFKFASGGRTSWKYDSENWEYESCTCYLSTKHPTRSSVYIGFGEM